VEKQTRLGSNKAGFCRIGASTPTMKNYTLITSALQMGGVYVQQTDENTSTVEYSRGFTSDALDRWRASFTQWQEIAVPVLSTAHIRPVSQSEKIPFFEFYENASIFKVSRGGSSAQVGGGPRGQIKGYSYASGLRMKRTLGQVRRDAELPAFVTLTYPDIFPTDREVFKKHLAIFTKRFRRKFHQAGFVWKLEPQKRGAPHYHLLVWGADLDKLSSWAPEAWHDIAGGGDEKHLRWHRGLCGHGNKHCVELVRSYQAITDYVPKYLSKNFDFEGWTNVGRFWGVVCRGNIPFGKKITIEVSLSKSLVAMRYQRRFIQGPKSQRKKRHKTNSQSRTIFCDASQWVNRLL